VSYYDDDSVSASKVFMWIVAACVLLLALGYVLWYFSLRADTAIQGERRTNINHQAEQQIANNSYLHSLLATIETDKQGIRQFYGNLDQFCQIHHTHRVGAQCANAADVTDYNDQQTYQQYEVNVTSAQTSLSDDVNSYNQYFANKDIIGVDDNLPKHVNADGSYRDVDGTYKKGVD
jgi:hypothetical protein